MAEICPNYHDLLVLIDVERARGQTIALTNGCFDLLHVGHVRMIQAAAEEADALVVALNSDAIVQASKGSGRPIVPLAERMEVIAAIEGVDFVTSFDEATADAMIKTLRPEVHCKGTDWAAQDVPERDSVESYGGRIAICGDEKTHSSSDLARRLPS